MFLELSCGVSCAKCSEARGRKRKHLSLKILVLEGDTAPPLGQEKSPSHPLQGLGKQQAPCRDRQNEPVPQGTVGLSRHKETVPSTGAHQHCHPVEGL